MPTERLSAQHFPSRGGKSQFIQHLIVIGGSNVTHGFINQRDQQSLHNIGAEGTPPNIWRCGNEFPHSALPQNSISAGVMVLVIKVLPYKSSGIYLRIMW